jgi:imidazolonepropionase-like amidohydrolase
MEDEIGSLETGKRCDLAIFAADDFRIIPYRYATNLVTTVVVGGQVVVDRHGQRTTLPAPRTDRDPVATGTDR